MSVRITKLLPLFILFAFVYQAGSQVFSVGDVITDNFPKLEVSFAALDLNEQPYPNLGSNDFSIKEGNGFSPFDLEVICENREIEPEVSILLVLDQSFSMKTKDTGSLQERWEWVREGAEVFINTIKIVGRTQIGLTTFGKQSFLRCPFTNDKKRLIDSLYATIVGGGTDYNPPFLDKISGADTLLRTRPADMRRIVIFLTDGNPETSVLRDSIINVMRRANIQVYGITVTLPMNQDLDVISKSTGGKSFAVFTKAQLSEIYRLIAIDIQTKQFCKLIWTSYYSCTDLSRNRSVEITFTRPSTPTKVLKNYVAPPNSIASVTVPKIITFGDPEPGNSTVIDVPLTAENAPFTISNLTINQNPVYFTIIDWGGDGNPPPFTINAGETRTLKIRFTQVGERRFRQASLIFDAGPCPPLVTLLGGVTQVIITEPDGGEVYSTCDNIIIQWTGVEFDTRVKLSFSSNGGSTWNLITNGATGFKYTWKPPQSGTAYLIKAEVSDYNDYLWAKSAGGVKNDVGKSCAVQKNGLYVYMAGNFIDQATFETKVVNSRRNQDGFIAKYTNQGNLTWIEKIGSLLDDAAEGVCVDDQNNAYVTGNCYKGVEFGGNSPFIQEADKSYCYVAKYSSDGGTPTIAILGASGFYVNFQAWGYKIRYENNKVYVRGEYQGEMKFPTGHTLPKASPGIFTAEFDKDLVLLKVESGGTNYPDYSSSVSIDADGSRYETGGFTGTKSFSKYKVTSTGLSDIYLAKHGKIPGSSDSSDAVFTVAPPIWTFDPSIINVGDCTLGSSLNQVYPAILKNLGKVPIKILTATIEGAHSTDYTLISAIDSLLTPNETMNIEIAFVPSVMGNRSAELVLKTDCAQDIKLLITGNGICSGQVIESIDMGSATISSFVEQTFDCIFKNTNNSLIRINPVVEGDHASDFKLFDQNDTQISGQITVAPDECVKIKVQFCPSGAGERKAVINFNMPSGCELKQTLLFGFGVDSDIEIENMDWKERRLISVNDTTIIIRNKSSLPATLTKIEFENGSSQVFSFTNTTGQIKANDSLTLPVSFKPIDEVSYNENILLTFDVQQEKIPVKLLGIGVLPKIDAKWICDNPARPGETSTAYLYIKNPSISADLFISSIDFATATADYSWTAGTAPRDITIIKDNELYIPVDFHPTKAGRIVVDVSIISDAVAGDDADLLIETIVAARCDALGITVDTPIDFGNWLLCESDTKTIQIYNNAGATPILINEYYFDSPDSTVFTVLLPQDFEVPALGQRAFYVVFQPKEAREYKTNLYLKNSINEQLVVELTGQGLFINYYTNEKSISKKPGYLHRLPVFAQIEGLSKGVITDIKLEVKYDNKMLRYLNAPNSFNSSLPAGTFQWETPIYQAGLLEIRGSGTLPTPFNGQLFTLDFDLYLGENQQTSIYFKPSHDDCVTSDTLGTTFTLTDICFLEGRLIKISEGRYSFSIPSPNPIGVQAAFKFGIALDGFTRIDIINNLGSVQKVLVEGKLPAGTYDFEMFTGDIPSGVYTIRMISGPFSQSHIISITK